MEIAAVAIGVVNVTARAGSKIWTLCESWKEAPKEVHYLRDSLVRAQEFFSQVKLGIEKGRLDELASNPLQDDSLRQLELLLKQGLATIVGIEAIVQDITDGQHSPSRGRGIHSSIQEPLSRRRKMLWLANAAKVARLRTGLKEISMMICASLVSLNVLS